MVWIAAAEYGSYVALYKLIILLGFFLAWMPLVNWIYTDSQAVRADKRLWTAAIVISGAVSLWIWLLSPIFWIGILIFVIVVGSGSLAYVMHRNARVAEFEKVLTAEHLKGLFVNPQKKLQKASLGLAFITANKNEVPMPDAKTPEAEGFTLACGLIDDALWRRVSLVTLLPQKDNYSVIYEIDGINTRQGERNKEDVERIAHYIKHLADLDVEEKRKPQKGTFSIIKDNDWKKKVTWEVQSAGSTAGEQIRLCKTEDYCTRKIENLGFNENQFESIRSLRDIKSGLILISGPAKSGVTTTLYTLLGNHDPFMNNINTLERKRAADLANITQNEFSLSDTGTTTYGRKLQTLLRRGPDIVGISDCEDEQSAKLCCAAVKDGKIIYAVMQATSVVETIEKMLRFIGDKNVLADTLEAVINQRLVRTLCEDCRQAYKPNQALFQKFNIPSDEVDMFYRPGEIEYDKHGKPIVCQKCQGTGFYGRVGLFETIRMTDELRQVIRTSTTTQEIAAAFRKSGMLYMQEQSIKKVTEGITSINEVIRNFSTKPGEKTGVVT
jgi:type II secretory ATPase GspE/PulE/Tfp pilus assembly ATPase PilB-like protein